MQIFKCAKWIWINQEQNKDEYGEFFASFYCEAPNAVCRISCDGDYTLFINGRISESNQYGDFEHYKVFDEIDISEFLKYGENTIAVLVWHYGEEFQRYKSAQAGLIFEILQGNKILLFSDEHIVSRKSSAYVSGACKKITSQLGFSFLYDATKEDEWMRRGFTKGGTTVIVNKTCSFYLRPVKKLKRGERKSSQLIKNEENYYLIDLGEESVGLPSFEFISLTEQKITVFWGEDLHNGHVRGKIDDRNFSYEYIAKIGKNNFTNYMLRLGCRYLELYAENRIELEYLGIVIQTYPINDLKFRLENELDQRIYDICEKTLKLSMMEHYVDTPWREQCLYAFDSRNQMLCGYYVFENGNAEYARGNLKLIAEDRRADGLLSICTPYGTDLTIPAFSLYYFMAVKEYLQYTQDIMIIDEIYPKLISLIQVFICNRSNGLVCKFTGNNHWNFYDWSPHLEGRLFMTEKKEPDLIINCLFIIALNNLREISQKSGRVFEYNEMLEITRKNTKKSFYNKNKKAYSLTVGGEEFTTLGNSLAVISGVAENPREICEFLTTSIFSESSLSMKCFKYDALLMTDFIKWRKFILNEIRHDYEKMLSFGATSVCETLDGAEAFDGAGSLCHGWSSMPIYYYHILL